MDTQVLKSLLAPNKTKIVLLVMDGLGGLAMNAGGLTELETAKTPNMDKLAAAGILGQTVPISAGVTPGSGPAHLSLFGYDPMQQEVGGGLLESIGVGMRVNKGDVAARGNFCTVDANGLITDRRAGRIPTEEASVVVEKLKGIELPGVKVEVKHVKEHRFAVVLRGEGLFAEIEDTDPQKTGVAPLQAVAKNAESKKTADLYNQWIAEARKILTKEPKANALTLRGFATDPALESYADRYQLKAACVAVYPMYKGVAQLVGMDVIHFDGETPEDEFAAVAKHWDEYDFFFVHIKKTDSYGEDGNFDAKVHVIETVDAAIPSLMKLNPDVLIITGDHSTPAKLKSHSWHPVPLLLSAPETVRSDHQVQFGERACLQGGLGTFSALEVMPLALGHALRLNKYGA